KKTKDIRLELGISNIEISNIISNELGNIATEMINENNLTNLFLTGGDTAQQVFTKLGIGSYKLIGELELGVPIGEIDSQVPIHIMSKAGNFGTTNVMTKAYNYFQNKASLQVQKGGKQVKPIIEIMIGDEAGIGPEIIIKALSSPETDDICRPIVIGDAKRLQEVIKLIDANQTIHSIEDVSEASFSKGTINCIDLDILPEDLEFGQVSPIAGDAAFQYIKKSVDLAIQGEIQAICTAPLNKEALAKGGHPYPGHTEILAELTNTKDYSMMLS